MSGRQHLADLTARVPETQSAIEYGERLHAEQHRSFGRAPFIEHPLEVGVLLYDAGAGHDVIVAGILHDTIEKTGADSAELRDRFGPRVAELVTAMSEDESISDYARRKAALRQQIAAAGPDALAILAADKISKVRELRLAIARALRQDERPDRSLLRPRRLTHYRRCLRLVEESLGSSPLVEELRLELVRLDAVLAGVAGAARAA